MDRRKLIREYKEARPRMGICRVRNRAAGRSLVAASVNVPATLNRHRAMLRMGVHADPELQDDWRELGPDAFDFEVLDTLEPPDRRDYDPKEDLGVLERLWRERLEAAGESLYPGRRRPTG